MITRVIIKGYRLFDELDLQPNPGMNVLVGANESGKSTLLEAVALALTGKINGRRAEEELNPFWFNRSHVRNFFVRRGKGEACAPPTILIECYLNDQPDDINELRGVHNSLGTNAVGVSMSIVPSEEYSSEFRAYLAENPPAVLPVEFYDVVWQDFSGLRLGRRPKHLAVAFIDSRTIRSTSGVDYHTREILSEHLDARERALISLDQRRARQQITDGALAAVNTRIAKDNAEIHDRRIGLQMDQSARTSWETGIVPQVEDIPFAMAGQGQQASVKVSLAMSRTSGTTTFVLIEEPENHLSHSSLRRLVKRIDNLASTDQQLFVTTHSSFVLNRLGLDRLLLLHEGRPARLTMLDPDTVRYFQRLSGYDTLRLVLADKVALVEGPSDEIVLARAFRDATGMLPVEAGIDVISMGGLTFRRALEICSALDRQAVALQDNDDQTPDEVREPVAALLATGRRELLVSEAAQGSTLEAQLRSLNEEAVLRRILKVPERSDLAAWMARNKTEGALRILESEETLAFPPYIEDAVGFLR